MIKLNLLTWTLAINIVPHNKYKFASEKMPFTSSISLLVKPNCLRALMACSTCKINRNFPMLIGEYENVSGSDVVFEFISIKSFIRVFRKLFWIIGKMSPSLVILSIFFKMKTSIKCFKNQWKIIWLPHESAHFGWNILSWYRKVIG